MMRMRVLSRLFFVLLACCAALAPLRAQTPSPAPVNPAFTAALGQQARVMQADPQGIRRQFGCIPSPYEIKPSRVKALAPIVSLPPVYDLRLLGKVTPVRDQSYSGSCWAHAVFASLESYLLTGETWDFSENNLKNCSGFTIGPNNGGNANMAAAYLTRWDGPVSESDDPYDPGSTTSPPNLPVQKHVQEVLFLPSRADAGDNDALKQAIMQYGAIYTAFYWDNGAYNGAYASYYFTVGGYCNHAVAIVGWDDNFSRDKFVTPPPGDGAFIAKNSWSTGFGDSGYFYVSYYDKNFGYVQNAVFENAESTTNYSRGYQYDPYGWVTSYGYGTSTAWYANIFTAVEKSTLTAVGMYAPIASGTYTVKVYLSPTNGPLSPTLALTQTASLPWAGYHTIVLNAPVTVLRGQRFSIVVKSIAPGSIYPIPVETAWPGYSEAARSSAGQSYISADGLTWTDFTRTEPTGNVCVKAFTQGNAGPPAAVTTPAISPDSTTFTSGIRVTMTCDTHGALIHYTTDGSTPTEFAPTYRYSLYLSKTTTIQARAFLDGMTPSDIAVAIYQKVQPTVATPALKPASGSFRNSMLVTISCATSGATIRYTLDGREPTASSPLYRQRLALWGTTTLRAKAFKSGMNDSGTVTGIYTRTN